MIADNTFAGRIMAKYAQFGSYEGRNERLVFLAPRRERANIPKKTESQPVLSAYQMLLRFYMTWQNYVRPGQQFSDKISRSYNQYAVFWNIASIFENRGSRPDLAKKAERELLRTLSDEFYTELIFRKEHAKSGKGCADSGGQNRTGGERRAQILRTQSYQEELGSTKRMVGVLEEQMKLQETILTELRQKIAANVSVPETNIKKITGEVMKQMEREMHLERLRRGL